MEVRIKCPNCGQEYVIDNSFIGQAVNCEKCGTKFTARKLATASPTPNVSEHLFSPSTTSFSSPSKPTAHQNLQSPVYSLKPGDQVGIWSWVKDFIDFKIMVTPSLIKISFILFFVVGALALLITPIVLMWKNIDVNETGRIVKFALLYIVYNILGIPLLAIILHMSYELLMIPFVILNTLLDIQNKIDKNNIN